MGLNDITSAERLHIGFFGMRNAGKSSLVNAVTGQQLSVVSNIKGTTTDPVLKTMELLPLGPVVIIDTPGLDDEGELGILRVQKARRILDQTDIAVVVVDATLGICEHEKKLIEEMERRKKPYVVVFNKADLTCSEVRTSSTGLWVSARTGFGVQQLKEALGRFASEMKREKTIIADLVYAGDTVVLVTPIDEGAPKGRLILPQTMTIRDLLDAHASALICQPEELKKTLGMLARKPKMVITDSQVFGRVNADTPLDIPLTSFSILMARYKGTLEMQIEGASLLSKLKDGDKVLISEGCTHHRRCQDIGTIKIPGWIHQFCGAKPEFVFTSGGEFPEDLSQFRLAVHCGGCMLNETAMKNRIDRCREARLPIVNYGIAIAHMNGILKRSVQMFPMIAKQLEK